MARSGIEFFRVAIAECTAAAQSVHDTAIRQAYLELARGWQALADEIERLRSQTWRPRIYSGNALPQRSLDDFYELRTPEATRRGGKHAIEHPTLDQPTPDHPTPGQRRETALAAIEAVLEKRRKGRARSR
jgi:hypothetical protein